MNLRAALAIVGAAVLSAGAQTAAAPELVPYRTLVTTRAPIVAFAQDGQALAWIERPNGKRCTHALHIRRIGSGRETTARICSPYTDLALAGTRVLWNRFAEGTSLTREVDVMTLAAGGRRPRRLEQVHVDFDPLDCQRLESTCRPEREPALAGGGGLLVYSTPAGVRRVVRGSRRGLLAFPAASKLAVAGGRVLALRSELRPGDGCGCASAPAWLPDGTIEYLSHIGAQANLTGELTRIAADGSGHQLLTSDRRFRQSLDVSPDGTRVAYGYVDLASSRRLIAVSASDGSGAHDLGEGQDPAWSPDGTQLAFDQGAPGSRQIYAMDANGDNVVQLTHGAESTQPAWSPDGTKIAYVVSGGIAVMDRDGSDAHSLGLAGSTPDWSPDGSRLVFDRAEGISIANADGSEVHVLPAAGDTPRWSPDGRWIVFGSASPWWDVALRYELSLVHPDGSGLHPLTFSVPSGWASPVEVRNGAGRLVSRFELPGTASDVAFGAQTLALAADAGPRRTAIALFDTRTGEQRGSIVLAGWQFAPRLIGISGRWLVVTADRVSGGVDRPVIRGINLTTSRWRELAVPRTPPVGLSLSGNRLAWAENPGGHGRIRALTLPR